MGDMAASDHLAERSIAAPRRLGECTFCPLPEIIHGNAKPAKVCVERLGTWFRRLQAGSGFCYGVGYGLCQQGVDFGPERAAGRLFVRGQFGECGGFADARPVGVDLPVL